MTIYDIMVLEARMWARDEFADSDANISDSTLALRIRQQYPKLFTSDCATIAMQAIDDYFQQGDEEDYI